MSPYENRRELLCGERPLSLSEIAESLPELNRAAVLDDPLGSWELAQQTVLSMEWAGIPGGSSVVSIDAIDLPDGRKAFFEFGALDLHDRLAEPSIHLIAASAADSDSDATNVFLEELLRTNGEAFGIALMASAPSFLKCTYSGDRATLVRIFVDCLVAARSWGMEPLESLEEHVELETDEDGEYSLKGSVASYLNQMLGPE